MKNTIQFVLLSLITSVSYAKTGSSADQCSTARILTQIRPGAAWSMQEDSVKKLKWLDKKQSKPSSSEVEKAREKCLAEVKLRDELKAQAKLDVKNPATPTDKKVQALIVLLDFDK